MDPMAIAVRAFRASWRGAVLVSFIACNTQQCDCYDVAPSADCIVELTSQPTYDEDSGAYLPTPDIQCTATLTGPANVITYDIGPGTTCAKHGGDAPIAASEADAAPNNGCRFSDWTEDGATIRRADVYFHLNGEDESFLGGLDFQVDVECSSGTSAIVAGPAQGQGAFQTRHCDG